MGIQVEFNPDLALRNINHYKSGKRSLEECIPDKMEAGKVYGFLKEGQRNYWLMGEIPLVQTEGEGKLSKPLASIVILESTHFTKENRIYTKGRYEVKEVFDPSDKQIHFDGFSRNK
jgi:hypothetical protein